MLLSTLWRHLLFSSFMLLFCAQGSSQAQSFFPAAIPLAVRSPYLNIWQTATNTSNSLPASWAQMWRQGIYSSVGWAGRIRVDGQTYVWTGPPQPDPGAAAAANVTDVQITPTRSIYTMRAGPMNFNVTFLSPIEPSDWVKQSIPFFYVSVEASSSDGTTHDVQLLFAGSAEILIGDLNNNVTWKLFNTGNSLYHMFELQNPQPYKEVVDQAQDGQVYYATPIRPNLSWQCDASDVTLQFQTHGTMTQSISADFGPIIAHDKIGIAVDLGNIHSTSAPGVAWAVGFVRDPVINYISLSGATEQRRPYYASQYSRIGDAIDAFTGDFAAARDRAVALDNKILQDALKISQNYADLVSLATRQAFASLDITVGSDSNGKVNASDVKIFMKDMGTSSRANPVERIFAAFPAFIYFNASIGGALLKPLLESQEDLSGQDYAVQDMGTQYPNAQIVPGAHGIATEATGNMLIMLYAHARFSGDGSLLGQHYNLIKRWADYLVNNSLTPINQATADAEVATNTTNLAIKGILGVKAMARISTAVGQDLDAQVYDKQASELYAQWQSLAMSSDNLRLVGTYNQEDSWSLMYNLYADKLLGTNLVTNSVFDMQTASVSGSIAAGRPFGLPIDSTIGEICSASWSLFTASTVTDVGVRDQLIQGVWNRASFNGTLGASPDVYNGQNGDVVGGAAGPALGAMFSMLALNIPNTTISLSGLGSNGGGANKDQGGHSRPNVGAIVGGVVGGSLVVGIGLVVAFVVFRRRQRNRPDGYLAEKVDFLAAGRQHDMGVTAYLYHDGSAPVPAGLDAPPAVPGGRGDAVTEATAGTPGTPHYGEEREVPMVVLPPSKAREAARYHDYNTDPTVTANSALVSITPLTSSTDLVSAPATGQGSERRVSISTTEVLGLRTEMEDLRRVVRAMNAERLAPPPAYEPVDG